MSDAWDALWATPAPERPPAAAPVTPISGDRASAYATSALRRECEAIAGAAEGTRNHTLNTAAYNVAQLVSAGHLPHGDAWRALRDAALSVGLSITETDATLRSGFKAGADQPRVVPERDAIPNVTVLPLAGADAAEVSEIIRRRFPLIDWRELWEREDDEEWILEPLLPARRLVALFSAPKVGKSLLMLEVAVGVARGSYVLGVTPDRPRRVLYVDFENDPRGDIRERLRAMGIQPDDLGDLCYLSYPSMAKLDTLAGAAELMAVVQEYECEVVVIDTISRAVAGEENDNDTWLSFYRNTGLAMKQAGVTCIRLDHTGKDHDKGMRGGSAKYGDVDAVWKLSRVTDDTFQLDCTDHRLPIAEKAMVIKRLNMPSLHHEVQAEGRKAAWDAKVAAVVSALDSIDAPNDIDRPHARDLLANSGVRASNDVYGRAIKERKMRAGIFTGDDE